MSNEINTETLTTLLKADEAGVLNAWVDQQLAGSTFRSDRMSRKEPTEESQHFLRLFTQALVQALQEASAPGEHDAAVHDVARQLRRGAVERLLHGVHDLLERLLERHPHLFAREDDGLREPRD